MRFPIALPVLLLAVLGAIRFHGPGALAAGPRDRAPLPTEELDGVILPFLVVELSAPTEGVLAEVRFDRGDVVAAGELMARLESSVEHQSSELAKKKAAFQSERKIAAVKLAGAQAKLEKREALLLEGIVTTEEVEDARSEVALAELDVLVAQEAAELAQVEYQKAAAIVARMSIHSPMDGVVIERHRSPGELVTRSETGVVFQIAQLDPLLVEVHAPVSWLGRIHVGDYAKIEPVVSPTSSNFDTSATPAPSAGQSSDWIATVRVIDQVADAASETVKIQFELPNPHRLLPGGVRCKLRMSD